MLVYRRTYSNTVVRGYKLLRSTPIALYKRGIFIVSNLRIRAKDHICFAFYDKCAISIYIMTEMGEV